MYLEGLGVPATQLATVSYGKELPLCTTHDEGCWARNRRALLEPNGKAKDLSAVERLDEARQHSRVARAEGARAKRPRAAAAAAGPAGAASATPGK